MNNSINPLRSVSRLFQPIERPRDRSQSPRTIHGTLFFIVPGQDKSALGTVPDDILMNVFLQLPPKDIIHLGRTSKRWYKVSRDEQLWKFLYKKLFIFVPPRSNTWFLEAIQAMKPRKPLKLDEPKTINGSFGHEMARIGNALFMFRKNEDKKYCSVTHTNLRDGGQMTMSYRDFLKRMTNGFFPQSEILDEGCHFYDPCLQLFYWANTIPSKEFKDGSKAKPVLSLHVFNVKDGFLARSFDLSPQEPPPSSSEKPLGMDAQSIKVKDSFVIVNVHRGFRVWNTEGKYLGHIVEERQGNYWIEDSKLCILDKEIIEYSLENFMPLPPKPATENFNPDASVVYKDGVLNLYDCGRWEIYADHLDRRIQVASNPVLGKITARWNDERLIAAAHSGGEIVIYDRLKSHYYPVRNTGIKNISQIERIYRSFFLLIDTAINGDVSEGHIQLWDLETNTCIRDYGTCLKKSSKINCMILPLTSFDGKEFIASFWNRNRREYLFKIFDFSKLHNQPMPGMGPITNRTHPSMSI